MAIGKTMIICTAEDYAAAEKVILDQSEIYEFRGPFLRLKKRAVRNPHIEAALIDILLSYDNEGRVKVLAGIPSKIAALRQRLYHIRQHTDPDIFRHEVQNERRRQTENMDWLMREGMPLTVLKMLGADEHAQESIFEEQIGGLEQSLARLDEMLPGIPTLHYLRGRRDTDRAFEKMIDAADLEKYFNFKIVAKQRPTKRGGKEGPLQWRQRFESWRHTEATYRLGDEYEASLLCDIHGMETVFETAPDPLAGLKTALPLLRESERNKIGLQIKVTFATLSSPEQRALRQKFPHVERFYDSYLKNVSAMQTEAKKIEDALAQAPIYNRQDHDLRATEGFERLSQINLIIDDIEYLPLVRKIITDREKDLQKFERRPTRELQRFPRRRIMLAR